MNRQLTKTLLTAGMLAGPLYVGLALLQVPFRPGFDLLRHDVSLLANGELGWIQVANLIISGLLTIAAALGMRQVLAGQPGGTWGPLLVGIYGLGLIGAGLFPADPAFGFPEGAPAGQPAAMSPNGLLHFVFGGFGFLALIAGCFVLSRWFRRRGETGWATFSIVTGVVFLASFVGIASGTASPVVILGFWAGVILAWTWLALVSRRLRSQVSVQEPAAARSQSSQTV